MAHAFSRTVWLYLLFLPFQLAKDFNWYTIPGTAVAAFFYLGFIAAGSSLADLIYNFY